MSSLFDDGCCCKGPDKKPHCKTCGFAFELLKELANRRLSSLCSMGQPAQVHLVHKGTNSPIALGGTTTPTVFTLVRLDPEYCCAVFTFEEVTAEGIVLRTFVTDGRSIAGIVCLTNME